MMNCNYFSCLFSSSTAEISDITEDMEDLGSVEIYSYKQLNEATQGFRSPNKIGEGGFGSVYKGKLLDGAMVAVKVLSVESRQGHSEFMAEIASMSNVRHKNLAKIRGVCIEGTHRILVYDYMENNSLAQILFGNEIKTVELNWEIRRDICLGIAHGLAHLHEETKPHIVHRDIKASNILLDWDFTAKVSDFGLSKLFPDNITHISTRVAGTLGYMAPEYAISGHLTRKSDVYSFGVLLLEILSGRCVIEFDIELGEYYLVEKAWEMYNDGNLLQLMDPSLRGDFPDEEVVRFLKVGLLCVQETPSLRPRMSKAAKVMSNEIDIREVEISKPGLIADLMKVKIVSKKNTYSTNSKTSTNSETRSSMSCTFSSNSVFSNNSIVS
ncbi:hypothetical protein GIB67_027673 [Kingdonia uniflora]|uniref:Protein kinase domain-containing protein n=1 Tax=Kingdonia uniflora TaxID=39325 RepID=A0A7J7NL23_9MAGN|nr:hypothetical protein GIB67_027673 [Kingdonia uniflora]